MPDEREQTAIAQVLSDMDAELATLEQRHDKTRVLKQGMMQELLTGKTRLVSPAAVHTAPMTDGIAGYTTGDGTVGRHSPATHKPT